MQNKIAEQILKSVYKNIINLLLFRQFEIADFGLFFEINLVVCNRSFNY